MTWLRHVAFVFLNLKLMMLCTLLNVATCFTKNACGNGYYLDSFKGLVLMASMAATLLQTLLAHLAGLSSEFLLPVVNSIQSFSFKNTIFRKNKRMKSEAGIAVLSKRLPRKQNSQSSRALLYRSVLYHHLLILKVLNPQ